MQELVITAVGPDRPGLVGKLTRPLLEASANVADSRMINLRGEFALLMLAEVPDDTVDDVQAALLVMAQELDLSITFRGHERQDDQWPTTVGVPFQLKTYAMDQPGIVHKITDVLQRHGVNIEELETNAQPRPQSGAPLFSMSLNMTVPAQLSIKQLRQELETLCDALNCDIDVTRHPGG